jgi:hypothetical protein
MRGTGIVDVDVDVDAMSSAMHRQPVCRRACSTDQLQSEYEARRRGRAQVCIVSRECCLFVSSRPLEMRLVAPSPLAAGGPTRLGGNHKLKAGLSGRIDQVLSDLSSAPSPPRTLPCLVFMRGF